jgi:hypothetical protein
MSKPWVRAGADTTVVASVAEVDVRRESNIGVWDWCRERG